MSGDVDIVVVGGGIHGVGVAQAGAARGHRVLLLEQGSLAQGTSSRSSKLIHGGLRYLETAQFGVVRECLRERRHLLRLAPDLVELRPFHIPVYENMRRSPAEIRLGLSLYALLGGFRGDMRFGHVPRAEWESLDGLRTDGLRAVFRYYEAQTDDVLLTRAVMESASNLGAALAMPASFIGASLYDDGVSVEFEHVGSVATTNARVIVNAAGPWINDVAARITPALPMREVDLVQGTHIVLQGRLDSGAFYVEAHDGRGVFAMPWKGDTLVGTTETAYEGDPGAVSPLPEEEAYLVGVMHRYFPSFDASTEKIVSSFAGLRVLPSESGDAFGRSRETVLTTDRDLRPRMVSIYGGKLTAYRASAERVLKILEDSLPKRRVAARTDRLRLRAA